MIACGSGPEEVRESPKKEPPKVSFNKELYETFYLRFVAEGP